MSANAPTVVTEDRVTVTASGFGSSEAEVRDSAGFKPAEPEKPKAEKPADKAGPDDEDDDATIARDAAGKFAAKEKPEDPINGSKAKPDKYGGDPRKDPDAKIERERQLRGAAERERDRLAAELAAARTPPANVSGQATAVPAVQPPPAQPKTRADAVRAYQAHPDWPVLTDFVDGFDDPYAAMLAAQAEYIQDKKIESLQTQARESAQQRQVGDRLTAVHTTGAERHTDWHDLFQSPAAAVDLPDAVLNELYHPELDPTLSADLVHHLLSHPAELEALARVHDPIAAARAITRLSTGLVAAHSAPAQTPTQTHAKPLIKAVSGSLKAPEVESPDDLPFGPRYIEAMNAKERKARNAGA